MSTSVADLFVVLDSVTDPFSNGMKRAAADAEAQSKRMSSALGTVTKVGLGLGAAAVGIGVASAKMGATFQATMETLHTQAGVAQDKIAGLSAGVLNLAGQVGFAPNSLAEALYHIESSFASVGITGPKALNLLQIAAEGAAVGHADLVDVTNALDAAIASGIPGVQDFQQAMGVLNSVVGSGDMTMQDLANAFSTGALANVKSYGASITDVGAALAVFGDNNIRGQNAATDLRMSMQALQTPAKTAADLLAKMGMDAHTLGDTMSQGGLLPALELLHQKMDALGYTEKTQGAALTELFGKKAGAGIVVLYDQLDRLKSKYPDQINGAKNFADAWVQTKATVSQQVKEIGAGVDTLGVRIGLWLIPQVSKLITLGQNGLGQVVSGFTGADRKPTNPGAGNAFLNKDLTGPPQVSGWQRFGEEVRTVLGDIEQGAKKLEPLGQDFARFGGDVYQGGVKLLSGLEPTAKLLGGAMLGALQETGHVLADVVGPAFKWFGDFVDSHKTLFEVFAVGVLGTMAAKMTIIGGINAARSVVELATSIAQFPLAQAGQIGDAIGALKTAYTGKDAAEGEKAIVGLKGALTDLKGAASGALDKIIPDSGKLAGLARVGKDIGGIEKAAADAQQLSLFETNLNGIVQVADHEQLALFATDVESVGSAAGKAEGAASGLLGTLGKFIMPVAIVAGVGMIGYELGKWRGVGRSLAPDIDQLATAMTQAADGSAVAKQQINALVQVITTAPFHIGAASMGDLDKALTQLVTSGHTQEAKDEFNQIAQALAKQGIDAQGAASKFPGYESALKAAGDAAQTMDGKIQDSLNAMQRQQGMSQFTTDLGNLQQQLKDSGNALSGTSTAASNNQQAFQSLAQEMSTFYQSERNSGVGAYQATADYQNQYIALENLAIATLGSKDAADKFLGTLNLIKPNYDTTINLNVGKAYQDLNGLLQTIDSSVGYVQITGTTGGQSTGGKAYTNADGGPVRRGQLSWVGERGPELVVFGRDGYVVPNEALTGSRSIDPRILSGAGLGGASGYSHAAGGGSAPVVINYNVNFAGSLMTEDEALRKLRTAQLQWSTHNGGTGWSVP